MGTLPGAPTHLSEEDALMDQRLLGRYGEATAAEYLRRKGYTILGMNYRTRLGEVDVIASNRSYIAFVEVKLRKNNAFADAREFVTHSKQRKVMAASQEWLLNHPTRLQPRFDVMEIYAPDGIATVSPEIRLWENAFGADT